MNCFNSGGLSFISGEERRSGRGERRRGVDLARKNLGENGATLALEPVKIILAF
jgi:hypothetical protein